MRLTRAEIDLQALRFNVEGIRRKVGGDVKIMGIVKANAYGHGIVEISRALEDLKIDYLGVGFFEEGVVLRKNGITLPILVLGGVLGHQIKGFLDYDLEITVSSLEIAQVINSAVAVVSGPKAKVQIKFDTGMGRLGVLSEHAPRFIERVCSLPNLEVNGLYSHFASSDEKDKTYTFQQLEKFQNVINQVKLKGIEIPLIHIANSAAILELPETYFNMVRPGIILYGVYPSSETTQTVPLKPVLSLKSQVVYLKELPPNSNVSYNHRYFTPKRTKIATIPIGYGDGYSRRMTSKAEVIIKGTRFPVVGTICMDQIMVDVGLDADIHIGDNVTLIGRDGDEEISVWELAKNSGTNTYEVLCSIASRVPRVIIN